MGEIVAAALVGHVPTIMLPESVRTTLGGGVDTSLVAGLGTVRQALDDAAPDTLVIFDTNWFTTTEHIVGGRARYQGTYTSEELPTTIADLPYDYPGAPDLAAAVEATARERGVRALNATNEHLVPHYPTLNILRYVHRGEAVMSVGICQAAEVHNFLDFGAALGEAITRTDRRVALLASGGMSHTFWPLDHQRAHSAYSPEHVRTPEARAFDERIIEMWSRGDHAGVIEAYPDYCQHSPEGFFGHYLMLAGAIGGRACAAKGRAMSEYENALGTGQVHVWFDLR